MDTSERNELSFKKRLACNNGLLIIVLLLAANLIGCHQKPVEQGTADSTRMDWADMDISQRKQHMEKVVLPIAASVFQSWRPYHYATIDCTLCHGQGVQDQDFHMPTNHLPRLSGSLFLGPEFSNHPDTTRLKLGRLVPEMAKALGKKPFSLITRRGFGCYTCHLGPDGPMFGN